MAGCRPRRGPARPAEDRPKARGTPYLHRGRRGWVPGVWELAGTDARRQSRRRGGRGPGRAVGRDGRADRGRHAGRVAPRGPGPAPDRPGPEGEGPEDQGGEQAVSAYRRGRRTPPEGGALPPAASPSPRRVDLLRG